MNRISHLAVALAAAGLSLSPMLQAEDSSTTTTPYTSGATTLNHPGRLLASNCFQCHGTNGHGMENLAGKSVSDLAGDLREMAQKSPGADMMFAHARGYTAAQVELIADYFSRQQP